MSFLYAILLFSLLDSFPLIRSQAISTSAQIPPLQWLNLTALLQGPAAPPLKDASIGYDDATRTLIIFGGESQGGLPQQQTYLLNLNTLTWSAPVPIAGHVKLPSPRSAAIGGSDLAASYRNGHVIIGGKGTDGKPLDDVWEFDFFNQFWSPVDLSANTVTPALLGASGGIDTNIPFNLSGVGGPTNSFFLMGGVESTGNTLTPAPLSEIWQLDIAGTLSANVESLVGTWSKITAGNNTAVSGQGGTIVKEQLVAFGGCVATANPNINCAQPYSYVNDAGTKLGVTSKACAVPRIGAALVANKNAFSASFAPQVFVLFGLFNNSLWDDQGGLQKGEVDVLDINGGSWARILPAGDPGTTGTATFPQPRSGAASISFANGLVGTVRTAYSDTIIFGGQDASGNYLGDIWVLRAYNGSITKSGQQWAGFGNGQLQTGVNAAGQGVTMQYMTSCASQIGTSGSSSGHGPSKSSSPSSSSPSNAFNRFNTSLTHKSLAPISLALLLPTIIFYRLSLPSTSSESQHYLGLRYVSVLMLIVAYGAGLAGLVSSFTSISDLSSGGGTSSNAVLKTLHGQAGLGLFIALYAIVPLLFLAYFLRWRLLTSTPKGIVGKIRAERSRADSSDTAEKLNAYKNTTDTNQQPTVRTPPPPSSSPSRGHLGFWFRNKEGRISSESATESESPAPHTFEVVNRPARMRQPSASAGGSSNPYEPTHRSTPRNLSDLSWLDRRRSVNAVGDLDYALMQLNTRVHSSTPATTTRLSAQALSDPPSAKVQQPLIARKDETSLHVLMHILILALCVLSLVELWHRASMGLFATFLAWTVAFYVILIFLSWHGRPRQSTLTVLLARMRGNFHFSAAQTGSPSASRPISMAGTDQFPFPHEARSPYLHQPLCQPAPEDDLHSASYAGMRSDTEIESDEDEETRQRRIEDEIGRRDVSIVTVPKRKLWVANPS